MTKEQQISLIPHLLPGVNASFNGQKLKMSRYIILDVHPLSSRGLSVYSFAACHCGCPQIPGIVDCREKGLLEGRVLWVFVFFFQESASKSLKTESGNLGSSPGSDLRQAPFLSSLPFPSFSFLSLGLGFPIYKISRLDFLMAKVPSGSMF